MSNETNPSQVQDEASDESVTAAILHRMLMKRAGPTNQLRSEELSQVVPSDQRDRAKRLLKKHAADPETPLQTYADRDVYTLASLEAGADWYEALTGNQIDYRSTEHSLSNPDTPAKITFATPWEHADTVDRILDTDDHVQSYSIAYEEHPPVVTIHVPEEHADEIETRIRDATDGDLP